MGGILSPVDRKSSEVPCDILTRFMVCFRLENVKNDFGWCSCVIYRHWEKKDRIEIGSQSPVLGQVFPIAFKKSPKSRFSPKTAIFFSLREAFLTVYCMSHGVTFHEKPRSCRWRGDKVMYLHDSLIWPHFPRYDSTTRIFLLGGLSNLMTKNVLQ